MILALLIHDRGSLEETSLQALALARGIGEDSDMPVEAVWIGDMPDGLELERHGAGTVHQVEHDELDDYSPSGWAVSLAQLVESLSPDAVITNGSDRGNEVMAHLGAMMSAPMVANVQRVTATGETWEMVRTRWGGSLLEETSLDATVKLLTVAEHAVEPSQGSGSTPTVVRKFNPELDEVHVVTKVIDRQETASGVTLATAPVVVSGGRGVGSAEGFEVLEDLAALLGGVVGCSRVVTNNGWRPHSDQVGQTGTVVAPDVYIACGISGAIQHWVGMMAAKTIIAINTDPEAPMVTKSDYAIIGDLKEVVPAIVSEIRRRTG